MAKEFRIVQFSMRNVIRTSIHIFLQNLLPFLFLALLGIFPRLLEDLLVGHLSGAYWLTMTLFILLKNMIFIMVVLYTVQIFRGHSKGILFNILEKSLSRFFPLLMVYLIIFGSLLTSIIVISIFVVVIWQVFFGIWLSTTWLVLIGTALLAAPGLALVTIFWVVAPVVVIEQRGVFMSFRHSVELTKGNRWKILGILALALVGCSLIVGLFGTLEIGLLNIFFPILFEGPTAAGTAFVWRFSGSAAEVWITVVVAVSYQFLVSERGVTVPDHATRAAHS